MPQPLRWIYLDADSFFASCELARRGHPIATPLAVASGGTGGSVIACSSAAKSKGVHRGQKIREGRLACPGLVVVPQHPPTYVSFHKRMLAVADEVVPLRHTFSVDEAAFELLPVPFSRSWSAWARL